MQKFVDVSNNNGHVDFVAVKKAGAVGVYLKVAEGLGFVDLTYQANRKAARAAGLKVGGYYFAHPEDDPGAAASFFLSHLIFESGDLIPMLDLERGAAPKPEGVVKPYAQKFIAAVKAKHGRCGIYCGSYFIAAHALADLGVPRWIPSYGARPKFYSYAAWQFTDGQPQYPGSVDKLDTSVTADIYLLVYKAPLVKKVKAVVKHVTLDGFTFRVGSGLYRWFVANRKKVTILFRKRKV